MKSENWFEKIISSELQTNLDEEKKKKEVEEEGEEQRKKIEKRMRSSRSRMKRTRRYSKKKGVKKRNTRRSSRGIGGRKYAYTEEEIIKVENFNEENTKFKENADEKEDKIRNREVQRG